MSSFKISYATRTLYFHVRTRTCAGSPPPRLVQPFYTSQQGRVEPRTAPPLCSALGRKVGGEGRGRERSAGGSEETGDWLEWTRSRNQGARGGPGARNTGNGTVVGARNPGSPSARKPGSCSRAVERQGTKGRRRSEARGGMGTGRGGPARDPNGWRRCAGVHAGEAPPCVGLNGAPLGTPPIGARAAAPWRPFVGADWSRLPTVWRACLAAQVSEWAACPPPPGPLRPGLRRARHLRGGWAARILRPPPAPAALWRP